MFIEVEDIFPFGTEDTLRRSMGMEIEIRSKEKRRDLRQKMADDTVYLAKTEHAKWVNDGIT